MVFLRTYKFNKVNINLENEFSTIIIKLIWIIFYTLSLFAKGTLKPGASGTTPHVNWVFSLDGCLPAVTDVPPNGLINIFIIIKLINKIFKPVTKHYAFIITHS